MNSAGWPGSAQAQEQGRQANENPPVLRTHDRFGHRVDEVEFHPAWHELMTVAVRHGLHAAPWRDARPGAHVARAAGFYVWGAAEAGTLLPDLDDLRRSCPRSGTHPLSPTRFEPLLAAREYDFGLRPPEHQAGPARGHVDDREAGWFRCPGQHHPRRSGRPTAATC